MDAFRVLLANMPWPSPGNELLYGVRSGSRWPHFQKLKKPGTLPNYIPFPHYLACAAGAARQQGCEVELVDAVGLGCGVEDFIARTKGFAPDVLLVETSTPSLDWDLGLVRRLRADIEGVTVVLCGAHAPMFEPGFLETTPEVDFVLIGEYEMVFADLLCQLRKDVPDFSVVKGLVYRLPQGAKAVSTGRREADASLDVLPPYVYDGLPMLNYNDRPCGLVGPSLQMWASRGCPFKCVFCQWPQIMYGGSRYRERSLGAVLDEMQALVEKYGFKSVYFDDDTFNVNRQRTWELAEGVKQRTGLDWAGMARADLMDEQLLEHLAACGMYSVKYGVETADRNLLAGCGKGLDLDRATQLIDFTRSVGIKVQLTFTFGFPGETWDSVRRSIDYVCERNPDYVQFSVLTPFPGTRLYDDLKKQGLLLEHDGFDAFNGSSFAVMRTHAMEPDELVEAVGMAYREFFALKQGKHN